MADFSALIAQIEAYVKQNGNNEITGNGLQDILVAMVGAIGGALNDAVSDLESADTTLTNAIGDEELARQGADNTLGGRITAEEEARAGSDTGLQNQINGINGKIPDAASSTNKLADKAFVQGLVDTLTASIAAINDKIPSEASSSNKLADKAFVQALTTALQNALNTLNGKVPAAATSENQLADKAFVTSLTTALQNAINAINTNIGNGFVYAGVATPSGTPVSGKVAYLAAQAGTYTNYGGLVVPAGISVIKYDGTNWSQEQVISMETIYRNPLMGLYDCDTSGSTAAKTVTAVGYVLPTNGGSMKVRMANHTTVDGVTLEINGTGAKDLYYKGKAAGINNTWDDGAVLNVIYDSTNDRYLSYNANAGTGDGVFDVSEYTGDDYAKLEDAIADIPVSEQHGGMEMRFVRSSDNKYVQYRYMGTDITGNPNPFLDTANWQGVDDEPVANSENLVKSGGVFEGISSYNEVSCGFKQYLTVNALQNKIVAAGSAGRIGYYSTTLRGEYIKVSLIRTDAGVYYGHIFILNNASEIVDGTNIEVLSTIDYGSNSTPVIYVPAGKCICVSYKNGDTLNMYARKTVKDIDSDVQNLTVKLDSKLDFDTVQELSVEQKNKALNNLGLAIDSSISPNSKNLIESGAVYNGLISNLLASTKGVKEKGTGVSSFTEISEFNLRKGLNYQLRIVLDSAVPSGNLYRNRLYKANGDTILSADVSSGNTTSTSSVFDCTEDLDGVIFKTDNPVNFTWEIIVSNYIADNAITTPKIADDAVKVEKIYDYTNSQLLDGFLGISSTNYNQYISECYIDKSYLNSNEKYVTLRRYNYGLIVRAYLSNGSSYTWYVNDQNIFTNRQNGDVLPLVVTGAGGSASVGSTVGYIVFKDIDGFKALSNDNGNGQEFVLELTTRLFTQGKIWMYLCGAIGNISDNSVTTPKIHDGAVTLEKTSGVSQYEGINISLPPIIYAVVGDKLQIFFHSVVHCANPYIVDVIAICSKGRSYPRYWEYTPTFKDANPDNPSTPTSTNLTIRIRDNKKNTIVEKSTTVYFINKTDSPQQNQNVLCIGASATESGIWVGEVKRRLTGSDGTCIFNTSVPVNVNAGETYSDGSNITITITESKSQAYSFKAYSEYMLNVSSSGTLTRTGTGTGTQNITYTSKESDPYNPAGLGLNNVTFVGRKNGYSVNVPLEATGGWRVTDYGSPGEIAYRFQVTGVLQLHIGDVYSYRNEGRLIIEEINVNSETGVGNVRVTFGSSIPNIPIPEEGQTDYLSIITGDGDRTITFTSWQEEKFSPFWLGDVYKQPLQLQSGETIKVIASKLGLYNSNINEATYNSSPVQESGTAGESNQVVTPSISIDASGLATVTCSTHDATISYVIYNSSTPQSDRIVGLDFTKYANDWCNGNIGVMIWHCGVNDIFYGTDDAITNVIIAFKSILRQYHIDFPLGKVIISSVPVCSLNGGMAASYGASSYANILTFSDTARKYALALSELCTDNEFSSFVKYAPVLEEFDAENGYPATETPVNNRSISVSEKLGTNGVHPTEAGSLMVADGIYRTFNAI